MPKHVPKETVILLAESKERIRILIEAMLTRCGYTVRSAPNGEEALAICKERTSAIHMLLTNIVMPGMNGFQLADAIREDCPDIKAVVISSHMDAQILKDNPEPVTGIPVVLTEDFSPLHLLQVIQDVLDNEPTATSAV